MPILELTNVTKTYNDFSVVKDFNFSVNEGELRCLLGPNGAGKTTTIDLITGRQKLTSGKIIFDGKKYSLNFFSFFFSFFFFGATKSVGEQT